jgi:hypothetical protein
VAFDCAKINKKYNLFDAVMILESLLGGGMRRDRDGEIAVPRELRGKKGAAPLVNPAEFAVADGARRAAAAAQQFQHFVFDARSVARLPVALRRIATRAQAPTTRGVVDTAAGASTASRAATAGMPIAARVSQFPKSCAVIDMGDKEGLVFALKQAAEGAFVESLPVAGAAAGAQADPAAAAGARHSGVCRLRIGHAGLTAGALMDNVHAFLKSVREDFPHVHRSIGAMSLLTPLTQPIRLMEVHMSA